VRRGATNLVVTARRRGLPERTGARAMVVAAPGRVATYASTGGHARPPMPGPWPSESGNERGATTL